MTSILQQSLLRLTGAVGVAIFASIFALTYSVPDWVERFAADFIEAEVNQQIDTRIDEFQPSGDGAITQFAAALYEQNRTEIERLKVALKNDIHERKAGLLAEIRDLIANAEITMQRSLNRDSNSILLCFDRRTTGLWISFSQRTWR